MNAKLYFNVNLISLLFSVFENANAQAPNWTWAKHSGGINSDAGYAITSDAAGNVYSTGAYSATADFDPGPGVFNLTGGGMYISKLDQAGNFAWAKRIGNTTINGGDATPYSLHADDAGNLYISGDFSGTIDFDPDSSAFYNLTSVGNVDIFICKLDTSGNFKWAKSIGGSGYDFSYSVTTDGAGNVYSTGIFESTVDFDPDTLTVFPITSYGYADIYISKFGGAGNFIWAKRMGGSSFEFNNRITISAAGYIYTTGAFSDTVDFDPGPGTYNLHSAAGSGDVQVCKFDTSGNLIWARCMGGTGADQGFSIAADGLDNVYVTGTFSSTADFDPGTGVYNLTAAGNPAAGSPDVFTLKLDSSGNFVWAKRIGNASNDDARGIVVDASANVFTTGCFTDTVDFDPGNGTFYLVSNGMVHSYISKMDSSGNFLWAKAIGGAGSCNVSCIAINSADEVYVTGLFQSPSLPCDADTLVNTDISGNNSDIFIAALRDVNTGLIGEELTNDIPVFPNPVTDRLQVILNDNNFSEFILYDIAARKLLRKEFINFLALPMEQLSGGIYYYEVRNNKGVVKKGKIVKL